MVLLVSASFIFAGLHCEPVPLADVEEILQVVQPQNVQSETNPPEAAAEKSEPALKLSYDWGRSVPEEDRDSYLKMVNRALEILAEHPPAEGDSLFKWKGDRKILEHKKFRAFLIFSDDPLVAAIEKKTFGPVNAFTLTTGHRSETDPGIAISVGLILDKVLYNDKKERRDDGFERMIIALAHEIYGNVQRSLEMDPKKPSEDTFENRRKFEIDAFNKSVKFIEKFMKSSTYGGLPDSEKERWVVLLRNERLNLKDWENKSDPNPTTKK